MSTGRRFKEELQRSPGPGAYEEIGSCAAGTQVCSNYHSIKTKNLGTSEKRT